MRIFLKNSLKYTISLATSLIGSEAFKFSSSLYIFKVTGDFWLVTILYLLIQIPNLIVYLFSSKIIQKWKNSKLALLNSDLLSIFSLLLLLIIFFSIKNPLIFSFSIILILINTLLGFIHSFRFIYLKDIVYYLSNNKMEMTNLNIFSTFAAAIGFLISAVFSIILYSNLDFHWLISFNILTYLTSGILYFSLKFNKIKFDFVKNEEELDKIVNKNTIFYKWLLILAGNLIIGIFLIPRTTIIPQFFTYINSESKSKVFNFQSWATYLNLFFSFLSVLGSVLTFLITNKTKIKINFKLVVIAIVLLNLSWLFSIFLNNLNLRFYFYVTIIGLQQILFSLFLPVFYSSTYTLFDKKKFHQQNGISLVFRIIFYSFISIITTTISIYVSFYFSFLFFSIIISLLGLITIFSYSKLQKNSAKLKESLQNK
ncbi:hypothetical protein [Mycoplasma sp. 'Moose RK']|uniref:hypothetical protein n=1 Tax=Mycoplasma sp. 'Moose RK' TaxID=2780095 RepID=UPI0018C27CF7|nr:hypothetical protein [Mycoplasma sp. 'Moose RK']MBG0730903.1 hypothetical protein [Mycoplasma sp. 'Moose RK']